MDQFSSNTYGSAPTNMPGFYDSLISAAFTSSNELAALTHALYNTSSRNVARLRYLLNQNVERRRSILIQYRDSVGAAPDVGLDRVAYDMLHYGVNELVCAARDDLADLLLQRAAPRNLNTIDAWFDAFAIENWGIDGHASRQVGPAQLTDTDLGSRMVSSGSQPFFTSNLDTINPSHPPLPSFTTNVDIVNAFQQSQSAVRFTISSHHQSFLNTDNNTGNMGKSTKKSTSTKKSSSVSAGNVPPTPAPPSTLDAAPAAVPAVPPAAPARLSARQQNLRKKQQEQQQQQQQQAVTAPPPQPSKTAKKSAKKSKAAAATAPKKTRYHPGHTIKFPPTAPIHHRFLCPYNSKPAKGNKPCLSYFSKRYDLTRHVLAKHHNNARGFGGQERDFYGCGPYTVNELRRRGVTETIVARKSVKGEKRVLAGVMGPEVRAVRAMGEAADGSQTEDDDEEDKDEDEDENEDEEMEDAGVEYLSDGDDKVDRDPPQGRKDDGNDGNGDGHASASLIAVA